MQTVWHTYCPACLACSLPVPTCPIPHPFDIIEVPKSLILLGRVEPPGACTCTAHYVFPFFPTHPFFSPNPSKFLPQPKNFCEESASLPQLETACPFGTEYLKPGTKIIGTLPLLGFPAFVRFPFIYISEFWKSWCSRRSGRHRNAFTFSENAVTFISQQKGATDGYCD